MLLEEKLEPIFHPDSYGYRPGRSAHDAVAVTRRRCWKQDWVLDLDVRAFFDSVPHDLLLKAVAHHTDERWVLLYIKRWLTAPMQMPDGTLTARDKGTPQGSPISPLLANVFMHYAFDTWMVREFPGCPFERYADDIVAHCDSEDQARALRDSIATRLGALGLELHPEKTKVVFCQDANRPGEAEHTSFDFLGYTFRGRLAKGRRGYFVSFAPAISSRRPRWSARRSGHGTSIVAVGRICPASPRRSTLRCEAGSAITGPSTAPSCTPSQGISTSISFDGPCRNSNDCAGKLPRLGPGWTRFDSTSPGSSPTGTFSRPPEAGPWEPYDGRLSRTVLREPGGAIPPGYSPSTPAVQAWLAKHPRVPTALHPDLRVVAQPGRSGSSESLPAKRSGAARSTRSRTSSPPSKPSSTPGTTAANRSCGPRPPTKSSPTLTVKSLQTRDTSWG